MLTLKVRHIQALVHVQAGLCNRWVYCVPTTSLVRACYGIIHYFISFLFGQKIKSDDGTRDVTK